MPEERLDIVIDPAGAEDGARRVKRSLEDIKQSSRMATDGVDMAGQSLNDIQSTMRNLASETKLASEQLRAFSKAGKFQDLKQATAGLGGLQELKETLASLQGGYEEAKASLKAFMGEFGDTGIYKTKTHKDMLKAIQKELEGTGKQLSKLADGTDKEMSRATTAIQRFEKQGSAALGGVATALKRTLAVYVSWRGISSLARTFIRETIEQEDAVMQLNAALQSTGHAAGLTSEEIQLMSKRLRDMSTYSDEAVLGMQSVLLTFKNIKGDTFEEASIAVMNLASKMGGDLRSTAMQLGRALQDPILGLTALRRAGIQFSGSQSDMIKQMAKSGDILGAQKIILAELESQYGGLAAAAKNTLGGALKDLRKTFQDMFELDAPGETSKLKEAIKSLTSELASERMKKAVNTIGVTMVDGLTKAAEWTQKLAENIDDVKAILMAIAGIKISAGVLALLGVSSGVAGAIGVGIGSVAVIGKGVYDFVQNDIAEAKKTMQLMRGTHASSYGESYGAWMGQFKEPGVEPTGYSKGPGSDKGGKSAVASLVENIRAQMKYLYAEGKSFLPVLDSWEAKLKPLSEDWMKIKDLSNDIRADISKRVGAETALVIKANATAVAYADQLTASKQVQTALEAQQDAAAGIAKFWQSEAWGHSAGLTSDADYLAALKKEFRSLSDELSGEGLDMSRWENWSDRMREIFDKIQSVAGGTASNAIETLRKQMETGVLTNSQYLEGLEALKSKLAEYPAVVKLINDELTTFNDNLRATTSITSQVRTATEDLRMAMVNLPTAIASTFASAIRNSESLSDAFKNLLKDIGALIVKAMILKALGFFTGGGGGLFGSSATTATNAVGLDNWVAAKSANGNIFSQAGLVPFANGGVIDRPTVFPFARGVGLMCEKGPEAIMPLERGSDGKLGVKSSGEGGDTHITMNVNAIDAQSFVQLMRTNRVAIESLIVENIYRNGAVRKAIQQGV